MELSSCSKSVSHTKTTDPRTRRAWTPQEEIALIAGLKEIISEGWRIENGFKTGYLKKLEDNLRKIIPGTELRAIPHINSRLSTWKKHYSSLSSMMSMTGIGWNDTMKMIDVHEDQVWEDYVKKDPTAKLMRYKKWPYYADWIEIFGKDRASGEHAEDYIDVMNVMDLETNISNGKSPSPNSVQGNDIADESGDSHRSVASGSFIRKKRARSKGGSTDVLEMIEMLKRFCADANATLREVASRMGYEFDVRKARKDVFAVVDAMEGLSEHEKFDVSTLLVTNTEELELFFRLPAEKKAAFASWVLARGPSARGN